MPGVRAGAAPTLAGAAVRPLGAVADVDQDVDTRQADLQAVQERRLIRPVHRRARADRDRAVRPQGPVEQQGDSPRSATLALRVGAPLRADRPPASGDRCARHWVQHRCGDDPPRRSAPPAPRECPVRRAPTAPRA